MPSFGTPIAEIEINESLIRHLLEEQHPDLAYLPMQPADTGWDNAMFRLGDQLAVRMPRRKIAVPLLHHEQTWLPQLAERLPIPVPTICRVGQPTADYPWQWSIVPWLDGVTADQEEPHANQVERFVTFLRSLHIPAPASAPTNPGRGIPLSQRAAGIEERMQRLETQTSLITAAIKHTWKQALNAPIDVQPTWLHGDLHARNVLVKDGVITGIIDWGDMAAGDRATDLASIWLLFAEQTVRQQAIDQCQISEATLQRAKGWAIVFGVLLLDTGLVDNPRHAAIGERTLLRVASDCSI